MSFFWVLFRTGFQSLVKSSENRTEKVIIIVIITLHYTAQHSTVKCGTALGRAESSEQSAECREQRAEVTGHDALFFN